jgi:multiple antibiotic resistance protein
LGVDINSFAVAGSFVIFFLAIEMILGVRLYKEESASSASVVPIAFPIIAGAGTLTTLISIRAEFAYVNIIIAIVINMILVYIVLKSTEKLGKFLGQQGISILRKVFGIILLAIAIKLFTTNIQLLF